MSERDDRDWLDLLAGREVPDADPRTAREARLLRESLLAGAAADATEPPPVPEHDPAREARLLEGARRAGLGGASRPATARAAPTLRRPAFPRWRWGFALAATAVLAVAIFLSLPREQPPADEPATMRGGQPALFVRQVADPQRYAAELAAALQAVGLRAKLSQEGALWYVEATLPDKPDPRIVETFERFEVFGAKAGPVRVVATAGQ
jgi:hypothetical protein